MEKVLEQSGFIVLPDEEEKNSRRSLPFVLTLITAISMAWALNDMFWAELSYIPIIITIFLTNIYLVFFSKSEKNIVIGLGIMLVLIVGIMFGTMAYWKAGAVDIANRVLMRYNYVTGLAIDYFQVPECSNPELASYLFFCIFLVILTYYLGLAIIRKHPLILTFIWLPVIGGSVFFEMPIRGIIIACAVISVVGTFAYSQTNVTKDGLYTVAIVVLSVLVMISAGVYFRYSKYSPSSSVEEMQDYFIEKTEEIQFGKADSPQGNLENEMSSSNEVRLKVTMSKPECIYLKGYTGSVWENGKWNILKSTSYSNEYEGMIKGYCQQEFHPLAQLNSYNQMASFVANAEVKSEEVQMSVRNISAFRKYTYIPYGISFDSLMEMRESNQDIYIPGTTSEKLEDNYYSASVLNTTQDYFLIYNRETWLNENSDVNVETGKYRIAEADYRKFVHKFYVPKEKAPNINLVDETKKIRETVKKKGEETEDDWTSADYSTEAVTLYRELGIPTRYVEGYIADARAEEMGADSCYHVDVQAQNAHAWVEIYKDGVGWIPVDVTPGFYQDIANSQEEQAQSQAMRAPQNSEANANQQQQEVSSEESKNMPNILLGLLILLVIVMAAIIVTVLAALLRRKIIIVRRRKDMSSENYRVRLEMSVLILKKVFRYKKWEENMLSDSVQNILNAYWYGAEAKRHITEQEVDSVQNYLNHLLKELVDESSIIELVKIKYVEVLV